MAAGVVKDSGASAGFDVYEEDDVSGRSLDSDLFWGRAREEQNLDYNIQRWSLDSSGSHKAPSIPVTDLQQVTEEMLAKRKLSGSGSKDGSGVRKNKCRVAKVTPAYRVAFGSQSSKPFRVLSNVKIAAPVGQSNEGDSGTGEPPVDTARYFQGTEELINFAMKSSDLSRGEKDINPYSQKSLSKTHPAAMVHLNSSYYPPAGTPQIRGLSFDDKTRLSMKSGTTQTPKMGEGSTRNSLEQPTQVYEGHVISDSNLIRRSTMKSSAEPGHSFSDSSLPENEVRGNVGVTKFPPRLQAFRFPQETFGLKVTEDGGVVRDEVTIGKLTKMLEEKGAQLQVPLPSGATLTVPLPVAKVFDHGLPDLSATGQDMVSTEEMIKQRLDNERQSQRNQAENMVNEATLAALQERPSLVLKQKKYADLLMSRPVHELRDVSEVQGMKFASTS
ncbi:hypothetical protein RvY_07253 [Ramazzottius varieornatus]|uniref:Uncharacterized protein n=1 Tax=Ramazzottius varieornatus TaxID=947166 RepID=A0A1D1V427_RAMVA|nr:hypothetical protein RvY_07253 [Ramazzottius varieornatus]